MSERVRPDVVGHFDLLTKFSERGSVIDPSDTYYRGAALDALRAVAAISPRFEVNTGAISRGYRTEAYPSDELIREAISLGARLVLTSDAHHPDNIGFRFEEEARRLVSLGCTELDVRLGDRFVPHSLV
jgi:histidinol-phosphatase (PHP family)